MKVLAVGLIVLLLAGCSSIEWQRAPLLFNKQLCKGIEPITLPAIDNDGYARFDEDGRKELLEYFIRVEGCLEKIQ